MEELLGKALESASSDPGAQLRAYCTARLCSHTSLSTRQAADITALLMGWYLTHAWLHQAGIYNERLTSIKASFLNLGHLAYDHEAAYLLSVHILCVSGTLCSISSSPSRTCTSSLLLTARWPIWLHSQLLRLLPHAIHQMMLITLHDACTSPVLTNNAGLAG